MNKRKSLTIIIIVIFISSYFIINLNIGDDKFKNLEFPNKEQRNFIKKYLFPYKMIAQQTRETSEQQWKLSQQEQIISDQRLAILKAELHEAQIGSDIEIKETVINLSNNLTLKKYLLTSGFYAGINEDTPGSGYIDFYDDNLVIISSRGILAYKKKDNFKKINNNINDFIGISQFEKSKNFCFSFKTENN